MDYNEKHRIVVYFTCKIYIVTVQNNKHCMLDAIFKEYYIKLK